jgi:hypothetical protein
VVAFFIVFGTQMLGLTNGTSSSCLQTTITIEMSLVLPKQTIILELDIKYKQMKAIFVNDFVFYVR